MDDRFDRMGSDQRRDELAISDVADMKRHAVRQRGTETGRQIVEHDDMLACIDELMHHMAADIAATPGHQDGHRIPANSRFPATDLNPGSPRQLTTRANSRGFPAYLKMSARPERRRNDG